MKRLLLIAAICVVAAPAMAIDWHPITGTEDAMHYDTATGQISKLNDTHTRAVGRPLWSLTDRTGFGTAPDMWLWLDCADMENNVAFQTIGWAYYTNCQLAAGPIELWMPVYTDEDNFEDDPRKIQAIFVFDNLPGSTHPVDEYWGAGWLATYQSVFPMNGADLDGDTLQDFGYGYMWPSHPAGIVGAASAGEPNVEIEGAPGADDGWVFWDKTNDPNFDLDPNLHDPAYSDYIGYYDWTDPNLLGQFYFELYAPGCPNAGDSGRFCEADIYGFDCLVNLNDLAQLLGNYGMTTGASLSDGDVDPYDEFFPGDGDVDLGDLAELLSQYGDDCNE